MTEKERERDESVRKTKLKVRERERERERKTERATERETDRERERKKDRESDREKDRERERERERNNDDNRKPLIIKVLTSNLDHEGKQTKVLSDIYTSDFKAHFLRAFFKSTSLPHHVKTYQGTMLLNFLWS